MRKPEIRKNPLFILLILFLFSSFLHAADWDSPGFDSETPLWLRIEMGKAAVRERELGVALGIFRTILADTQKTGQVVPEAEMWLGYIFEQEGELELARQQYLKALEHSDKLYIPDDRFTILYNLANIYQINYQYGDYEKTLRQIIQAGKTGSEQENIAYQESLYNALFRVGLDRLFVLYREDQRNVQDAYSALGIYYYRTGLYRESIRNCLGALVSTVTCGVEYLQSRSFDYEFTTMENFIRECGMSSHLSQYLSESLFYQNLYYLGAALYASGSPGPARDAWQALYGGTDSSNPWRDRANRQLRNPFVEPVMSTQGLN